MFRLEKEFRFEAAHHLPHHDGKCSRLHGHSWVGRIVVEGEELHLTGPKKGMLLDYGYMKIRLQDMVDLYLDHHFLNETLKTDEPTSERIAEWVFNYLKEQDTELARLLVEVQISETCTSSCTYRPNCSSPSSK